MEGAALPHHYPLHDNSLYQPPHHTLPSQFDLDPSDPFQFNAQFDVQSPIPQPQTRNVLDPSLQHPRFHEIQPHIPHSAPPRTPVTRPQGGQFGILTPHNQLPSNLQAHHEAFGRMHNDIGSEQGADGSESTGQGHFGNLKIVPNPPNLGAWRERLFNVSEPIELTDDE